MTFRHKNVYLTLDSPRNLTFSLPLMSLLLTPLRSAKISRLLVFWLLFLGSLAAQETRSYTSFAKSERLWISSSMVRITPAQSQTIRSQQTGDISILLPDNSTVKKDQVWAVAKPERIALEEESIELEKRLLNEKISSLELDAADQIDQSREKLNELQLQKSKLQAVLSNPEFSQNQELKKHTEKAIALVASQLDRANERLNSLRDRTKHDAEIAKLNLDYKKRVSDFDYMKETSEYRARFDGILRYELEDKTKPDEFPYKVWLESGAQIASITNDTHFEVALDTISPSLHEIKKDTLVLKINTAIPGQNLEANFDRVDFLTANDNSIPRYIFKVREDDTKAASQMQGTQPIAVIHATLESPCHIVPKAYLIAQIADSAQGQNWAEMVAQTWPDAQLIAVGYHTLAVQAIADKKPAAPEKK